MSNSKIFGRLQNKPPRPPSIAMDMMGRVIEPGHLMAYSPDGHLVVEVVSVTPILRPDVPSGLMEVTVQARFALSTLPAQPIRQLVIVGETQARLAAKAGNNGQMVPEPEPDSSGPTGPVQLVPVVECPACGSASESMAMLGEVCLSCGDGIYKPVA